MITLLIILLVVAIFAVGATLAAMGAKHAADKAYAELFALRARVVAFAGQLQSWGYDAAAASIIDEILVGEVKAPDYYALKAENAKLKEELRDVTER